MISNVAPRFVGGRDEATGLVYGLQEITPWTGLQEGDFELVFDNFAGDGLNNTVDSDGARQRRRRHLAARQPRPRRDARDRRSLAARRGRAARHGLALGAGAAGFVPDADGVIHSQGGVLPPPVAGKSVNVKVRNGRVFYKPPGAKKFVELKDPVQVPIGTDVRHAQGQRLADLGRRRQGRRSRTPGSTRASSRSARPRAPSRSPSSRWPTPKLSCPKAQEGATAAAKKPKTRKLWGDGKGRFRTRGKFSSATVRGTKWVVIDRCDGTLTRVVRGIGRSCATSGSART